MKHKLSRALRAVLPCLLLALLLSACETTTALTFSVETGDRVKVTLNTTDGYKLSEDNGSIVVEKDGDAVFQASFLTNEMYEAYLSSILSTEGVTILEDRREDNGSVFFRFDGAAGTEYTYLLNIRGTRTSLLGAGLDDRDMVEEVFSRLTFEKGG